MPPIRVLELRSVWGTGGGPEKTIILGAARADPSRYRVTVCYVRDDRDTVFGVAGRLAQTPVDYVEVRERHSFDLGVWPRLRALVRERGFDIVHAHDYKTNVLALALQRAEGVAALSTAHGWTGHSFRERRVYYPLDKRVLARFGKVVAVSSDIRRQLLGVGARPERVVTILNAIDHEAFRRERSREAEARGQLGLPPDAFVVGGIGRLEPQKRFDVLVRAFAQVRASRPGAVLVIAGDGSLRGDLDALVGELGLADAVRLLGHRDDVPLVHHALDLFVQSSIYEGTPNAVLEAMAFETPVVATDVGGTAELAEDGVHALIVPPSDQGRLSGAMARAMADPAATAARAAAARRRVETELSFATRMQRLEAIYDELAAQAAGRRAPTEAA